MNSANRVWLDQMREEFNTTFKDNPNKSGCIFFYYTRFIKIKKKFK